MHDVIKRRKRIINDVVHVSFNMGDYSKNPCLCEIGTISNEAGGSVIRHEAVRPSDGSCFRCQVGDCANLTRAWVLAFIPQPKCGIFSCYHAEKPTKKMIFDTNCLNRAGACTLTGLARERTHDSSRRRTRMDHGKSCTYWSVWGLSEVYYALPLLHSCHLSQIIEPNSRNK